MPVKAPVYKAAPPVAVFSWTGFYIGVDGGADRFNKSWFVPDTSINVASVCAIAGCNYSVGSHSSSSWLLGGLAGFNYQINQLVLGVEAQADWTNLQGSNSQPLPVIQTLGYADHSKTDSLGTIAARLGVTWDRTLLYAKGGGAWAHDKFWVTNNNCNPCQGATETRWGWMVGAGVEQALTSNWSMKLEYNQLDFGNRTDTLAGIAAGSSAFQYNIRQTVDLIELGIIYRFGDPWGKGPVVAKY
jgi:outer membrane immunogenic protein